MGVPVSDRVEHVGPVAVPVDADELADTSALVAALDHDDDSDGLGHERVLRRHPRPLRQPVEAPERAPRQGWLFDG